MSHPRFDKPLELRCPVKNYTWGKKGVSSLVGNLSSEQVEPSKPYAELWVGAHASDSALVSIGDDFSRLDNACRLHSEFMLGDSVVSAYGVELPFLAKVLSIDTALSIQAHPSKQVAAELHKKDPEHYPDSNHKPEIAVALTEVELLWGFRAADKLRIVLKEVPEFNLLLGREGLARFTQSSSPEFEIKEFVSAVLRADSELLKVACEELGKRLGSAAKLDAREQWVYDLWQGGYRSDVGLFFFFMLNYARLAPEEAIYTPAGVPHAYLSGDLVECMANSDNVVRAGLTPKFRDTETLLSILDYSMQEFSPLEFRSGQGLKRFKTDASEFEISMFELGNTEFNAPTGPAVFLSVDARGKIEAANFSSELKPGRMLFIPAAVPSFKVSLEKGRLFLASVPRT